MNNEEGIAILRAHLNVYRGRAYSELAALIGEPQVSTAKGASGIEYQLEVKVFWDGATDGDLRILGSVDDGGGRAFKPLSADFILSPNGTFVGE